MIARHEQCARDWASFWSRWTSGMRQRCCGPRSSMTQRRHSATSCGTLAAGEWIPHELQFLVKTFWQLDYKLMVGSRTFNRTNLSKLDSDFQLGESSGGHMALTLAMRWRKRFFEPVHCPNGVRSSTCAVAADDPEWLPDIKLQFLVYPVVRV